MNDQESLQQFLEDFKAQFLEVNPMFVLPLLLSIDMKTWTFPEIFHHGAIRPQIEFIENHTGLRELMQNMKEKRDGSVDLRERCSTSFTRFALGLRKPESGAKECS